MTCGPGDPVAAVTHADPYPYYAALVRERPFYHDEALGLWVASGAEAVASVLASPVCRVRPPHEPVPKALLGSAAGEVFRRLVRMNDGPGRHGPFKRAVSDALASVDPGRAELDARRWAGALSATLAAALQPGELTRFMFELPVHVVGSLLGIADGDLPRLAVLVGEFVRCLAPSSPPEQVESGAEAAAELLDLVRSHLAGRLPATSGCLLPSLARGAGQAGHEDPDALAANGVGLLSQTYEATAGLIGNALLALARDAGLCEAARADRELLHGVVDEVARFDPSIQNTRRWAAEAGLLAGLHVMAGDGILVVLAAANRDPAANLDPGRFDPSRQDRRCFTFGAGVHACPGERLATTIAAAGVERLVASGFDLGALAGPVSYRASVNARIPLL